MVHGKGIFGSWAGCPAFPLFLKPLELRSLFSFPDGQEECNGGNCHGLITAQKPLYDRCHGRQWGSYHFSWDGGEQ